VVSLEEAQRGELGEELAIQGHEPSSAAIRKQNPHDEPQRSKKSPAPLFHAASKRFRDDLRAAYYAFLAAYRVAAEWLKAGILPVVSPAGSFPPALPFVGG
jgi:hypothetical protein